MDEEVKHNQYPTYTLKRNYHLDFHHYPLTFPVFELYINGITHCVCVWLPSLKIMYMRFILQCCTWQ